MKIPTVLGALLVAVALVPAANAAKFPTLKVGDSAVVSGTDLACAVGRAQGKLAVDCFRLSAKGPVRKSYAVGLAATGLAVLQHVGATGKIAIVRKLQSVARAAKTVKLGRGGGFEVARTDLGCVVVAKAVACFRFDTHGPLPRSYGIVLSDKYAAVTRYSAKRKASAVVAKLQGR